MRHDVAKSERRVCGFFYGGSTGVKDTYEKFKTRSNAQGTEIKSHAYRALRRSRLKEMHAVRYADDFKIFCASHEDAVRAYKATELWLKDRLGLEISPDKSKVVNLKRQYSDFLGFKLKVRKKGKKYVVRSHMSDKAYKKAHDKVSEEVKELAHSENWSYWLWKPCWSAFA